jgi:hypothetical protein
VTIQHHPHIYRQHEHKHPQCRVASDGPTRPRIRTRPGSSGGLWWSRSGTPKSATESGGSQLLQIRSHVVYVSMPERTESNRSDVFLLFGWTCMQPIPGTRCKLAIGRIAYLPARGFACAPAWICAGSHSLRPSWVRFGSFRTRLGCGDVMGWFVGYLSCLVSS